MTAVTPIVCPGGRSHPSGSHDRIQTFREPAKRNRRTTKERVLLSELRDFGKEADDRFAIGSLPVFATPSTTSDRSAVSQASAILRP